MTRVRGAIGRRFGWLGEGTEWGWLGVGRGRIGVGMGIGIEIGIWMRVMGMSEPIVQRVVGGWAWSNI